MSLNGYFEVIKLTDFKFEMASEYLKGTTGNKNITSASIAFKLPFLYILLFLSQNKYLKALIVLIASFAYFNLILLSSRAIIVSLSICIVFYISGSLISFYRSNSGFKFFLKQVGIYLLPIMLATTFAYASLEDQNIKIGNRISTINTSDVSASTRLRYYEKGFNYFLSNPIFGSGIGNWQLFSIKLDSDKIESYIVPYVAHNDYIELLTEIGLFGTISYLFLILTSIYFLLKIFFKTKDHRIQNISLILTLPFIIYFIDSNLNFPFCAAHGVCIRLGFFL
jgi:O-antigen ligase